MSKKIISAFVLLFLVGCENKTPSYQDDPELRREIFKECMKLLPAGPKETVYNDWDEVVAECDSVAYYQAKVCVKNCLQLAHNNRGQENGSINKSKNS